MKYWHKKECPKQTLPLLLLCLLKSHRKMPSPGGAKGNDVYVPGGPQHCCIRRRPNCSNLDPCVETRDPALREDPLYHREGVRFLFGRHDLRQHHLFNQSHHNAGKEDTWRTAQPHGKKNADTARCDDVGMFSTLRVAPFTAASHGMMPKEKHNFQAETIHADQTHMWKTLGPQQQRPRQLFGRPWQRQEEPRPCPRHPPQ